MFFLMIVSQLMSAAAPAPATEAPVVRVPITAVTPPVPRQPLERLFAPMDYPAAAEGTGAEGRVDVGLVISPAGRVSGCVIKRSSGSSALDATTCRILQSRARFDPARDKDGAPTMGVMEFSRQWKAPARRGGTS